MDGQGDGYPFTNIGVSLRIENQVGLPDQKHNRDRYEYDRACGDPEHERQPGSVQPALVFREALIWSVIASTPIFRRMQSAAAVSGLQAIDGCGRCRQWHTACFSLLVADQ